MRILVVGGATGGHVTPIRPVLSELRKLHPKAETVMIGLVNDRFTDSMAKDPNLDRLYRIRSGKWRRYSDDSVIQRIIDVRTHLFNLRDIAFLAAGYMQARRILKRERPDAIFIKGGFVGVPVGYAAAHLGIDFITHDSDALPGVANRLIAKKAVINAVGASEELYSYPKDKLRSVGVPISHGFQPVSADQRRKAHDSLGLSGKKPLILVTGGSLGAQKLNQVVLAIAPQLVKKAHVVHIAGAANRDHVVAALDTLNQAIRNDYEVLAHTDNMLTYLTAADVVVTRAGATTLAELSAMTKPAIFIPAPQLADQQKNAEGLKNAGLKVLEEAALVANPELLRVAIDEILDDANHRRALKTATHKYARPDAASDLAKIISEVAANSAKQASHAK